jgi:FHS family L-fucose permease-like MFS transporter
MQKTKSYLIPFILITSLFFLWGFVHNLDPILIPHLKHSFSLTTTQATLVDSAVFIAYFFMALPAGHIMKKWGYKMGIISGLLLFSFGSFLFIPAANHQSYNYFLIALFVIACGLTILETAANPYASALGDPSTASQRLNFAQSFNGLATCLAPIIGAKFILIQNFSDNQLAKMSDSARKIALAAEANTVKMPYTILGIVLLVIAALFYFIKFPDLRNKEKNNSSSILKIFKYKHLKWAVIAQFFYVGAQICVFSLFILYANKIFNLDKDHATAYLTAGMFLFFIGRFSGSLVMKYFAPQKLLTAYSMFCVMLCIIVIMNFGMISLYALLTIFFFMSIMFPTIFSLGIKDLGADTEMASSLIVMSIVGGAIMPRIFGIISDTTGKFQLGYIVPLFCFIVVAYFGWKGYKVKLEN